MSRNNCRAKLFFLGSGPIAVPVLRHVAASPELELLGVGTQIDRPGKRGKRLIPTPLGAAADEMGLHAMRIADVNAPEFLEFFDALGADFLFVVSFGQILKKPLLALPGCDCINVHASLLPEYRGASPIVHAILDRRSATGVGFMRMVPALDAGPVYRSLTMPLDGTECADSLELALGELAGAAAAETLNAILGGELAPVEQDHSRATKCGKVSKSDGNVDLLRDSALHVDAMVRAYAPWPGARLILRSAKGADVVTVTGGKVLDSCSGTPGRLCTQFPKRLILCCADGAAYEITELAPAGGKRMPAAAYLNGLRGEFPVPEAIPEQ